MACAVNYDSVCMWVVMEAWRRSVQCRGAVDMVEGGRLALTTGTFPCACGVPLLRCLAEGYGFLVLVLGVKV